MNEVIRKLININGMYGSGAFEKPDFPDLKALLAHMDRFGIAASVTCTVEGRDLNPLYGNRKLIDDYATLPTDMQKRIIPSFVIAPAMLYRQGETEYLLHHFESHGLRCVSFFPATSRCAVREIEKVISRITRFNPIVLIDAWEMKEKIDYRDLSELAQQFPNVSFVIKQAMWWQCSILIDLMWRHKNIYADISWFHFRDAIKTISNHFGDNRLVFGIGPVAHQGAALASLTYANISTKCRECIAYGNLESLLEFDVTEARSADKTPVNPLWENFLEGNGLSNLDIIDAHGHIGPPARGWYIPQIEIEEQIAILDKEMSRMGISQLISSPEPALFAHPVSGNHQVEEAVAQSKGARSGFSGYFVYNPHYADELGRPVLDLFFSRSYFIGLKILPEYWRISLNDSRLLTAWDYAQEHHLPILIHTWENSSGTAAMAGEIAARYPGAIILLGHSGGGDAGRMEAEAAAIAHDNVYLEWCGSFTSRIDWHQTIERVGAHKLVYGTDTFFHDIAWELGRLLSLNLTHEQFTLILGQNMRRILAMRR